MSDRDVHYLGMAARLALRGHGGAEPNPIVGCVIVQPSSNEVVGWGYHRQCGGPHAEVAALQRAGQRAAVATLYCTLEPCDHTGKTPPCSKAIIEAGIARVVIARCDPNSIAKGGLQRIREAGIAVELNEQCPPAIAVSDSFVHRMKTGLPWVTAKWAQTIDGKIASRSGESKWISNQASRKLVHRERGRVDAILTGIGTILKDDPLLTAREVRVRRLATRIIIDPDLQVPVDAQVVRTASLVPTSIACIQHTLESKPDRVSALRAHGVEVLGYPQQECGLPLDTILRDLAQRHNVATVLVESGAGLLSSLFKNNLVNEVWVFTAPLLLGDHEGLASLSGFSATALAHAKKLELMNLRRRGDDLVAHYRVASSTQLSS